MTDSCSKMRASETNLGAHTKLYSQLSSGQVLSFNPEFFSDFSQQRDQKGQEELKVLWWFCFLAHVEQRFSQLQLSRSSSITISRQKILCCVWISFFSYFLFFDRMGLEGKVSMTLLSHLSYSKWPIVNGAWFSVVYIVHFIINNFSKSTWPFFIKFGMEHLWWKREEITNFMISGGWSQNPKKFKSLKNHLYLLHINKQTVWWWSEISVPKLWNSLIFVTNTCIII